MKLFKKSIALVAVLCLGLFAVFGLTSCNKEKVNIGEEAITKLSLLLDEKVESSNSSEENPGLGANLDLPYSINVNGEEYVVTYTTDNSNAKVSVDEEALTAEIIIVQTGETQTFKLTAEVKGVSKSWTFHISYKDSSMIKTQAEVDAMANLVDYAGWAAAASGTNVVIQGYVTHAHDYSSSYGNVSVWLQDDNGGYYGYRVAVASEADYNEYFKVGNKIAIEGMVSPYNGWQEMAQGCKYYYISDAAPKTYEYKDVTELWTNNNATSKESKAVQNQLVKVTGKVVSIPEFSATEMSIVISVGGNEYTVFYKKNYVTIPNTVVVDLKVGYTVEFTGAASISKSGVQLCPISSSAYTVKSTEVTAQDKVNGSIGEVRSQDIASKYYDSVSGVELLTKTADGCTVTYELSDVTGTGITLADGKLNVTVDPANVSKAVLTATISLEGAESVTYKWNISTVTDAEVVAEILDSIKNQEDLVLNHDEDGARQRLLEPVSPSSKKLTYEYTCSENDGYVTVGQLKNTGIYYFDVKKVPAEGAVTVKLVCTFTYEGITKSVEWKIVVGTPVGTSMVESADQVQVGTPYILKINQGNLNKSLYFNGAMSSYYGATVETEEQAKNLYLETAEGGYYMYFADANLNKTYVNAVKSGTYINFTLSADATSVWTFNNEIKSFTTMLEGKEYYLGTYKEYNTVSLSTVDKAATSFVACFFPSLNLETEKAYHLVLNHTNLNKTFYFAGAMDGYYYATTEVQSNATKVYVEAVEGGYHVYMLGADNAKTYLNIELSGTYKNVKLEAEAKSVWTLNEAAGTLVTTIADGNTYFLGTSSSKTYTTFSACSVDAVASNCIAKVLPGFAAEAQEPAQEPAPVETTIADLVATTPTADAEVIYIVTGTWKLEEGKETYGNGWLTDEAGNEIVIYGFCASNSVLTWGGSSYTYKNDKSYASMNIETGAVVKVGMVYTTGYSNYSIYLIEVVNNGSTEEPTLPETESSSVVIETYATTNSWTNGTLYDTVVIDANTTVKAAGTAVGSYGQNTGKYYTSGQTWRIYQAESGHITITSTSVIGSVVVEYAVKNTGVLLNGETQVESGSVVVVNGTTITLSVGNTNESVTNGQAQITKISVYYGEGNIPEVEETPEEKPVEAPANVETTIADLVATAPTTDAAVVYVVTGTWELEEGKETYGNGWLTDESGNKITIYGLCADSSVCVWDGASKYTFSNNKSYSSLNIYTGAVIKVGMVYTVKYNNYSAYIIEIVSPGEAPVTPEVTGKVISFADVANRTSFSTEQQVWEMNGITVTNDKASSPNNVADYSNPARFYAGSSLTVSCTESFTTVVITTSSKHFSDLTIEGATVTIDGSTTTIVFAEAVTSFTIASLAAQVRISQIVIS